MRINSTLLLFLLFEICSSQQLYFYIPDNLKQIPSSETYNVFKDRKGYIWFSTEAGLCRYNGSTLTVFDKRNGLPEGAVYAIKEDETGTVWMISSANRILFYKNDSLQEAPMSRDFKRKLTESQYAYDLHLQNDSIFIIAQYESFFGSANAASISKEVTETGACYVFQYRNNFLYHVKNKKASAIIQKNSLKYRKITLKFLINNRTQVISIPEVFTYEPWRVLTALNTKKDFFISLDNILIRIRADGSYEYKKIPFPIVCLKIDKEGALWAGTLKGGLYSYNHGEILKDPVINMHGFSITGICEDNENGMWCSTLEKGVFYCRNKYVKNYAKIRGLEKKAELLKTVGKSLFVYCGEKELIEFNDSGYTVHTLDGYLTDIVMLNNKAWLLATRKEVVCADKDFQRCQVLLDPISRTSVSVKQICKGPDERIFFIQAANISELKQRGIKLILTPLTHPFRCMLYDSLSGYLLVGTSNDLLKLNIKTFEIQKVAGIVGNISKICATRNGEIWVITKGSGIYTLKNGQLTCKSDELHLSTNWFFDMIEDTHGTLWLGSNDGLLRIRQTHSAIDVKTFNIHNGLPANEIFKLAEKDEKLFLSTNEGVCSIPLAANLWDVNGSRLFLKDVYVNGKKIKAGTQPVLAHNQNSLRFIFDVLTYKRQPAIAYDLVRNTDESMPGFSSGNQLTLNNLKPGHYKLMVHVLNNDKIKNGIPVTFEFIISKPYWKSPWFLLACLFTAGALLFMIVKLIVKSIRKKEENKTRINKRIAEYQMSALRAQMNPHFIFNCINSIQRYILTNQKEEAYNYLSKFSKLIRLVLNHADENLIALQKELEVVELYIELEQLRFENKFSYTISIGKSIDLHDTMIPPMMIQPYIENAIWHGLLNIQGEYNRKLSLNIEISGNLLEVIIEDNGIGRAKAGSLSAKRYRPKATSINTKRAEMLSISGSTKGTITTEDLLKDSEMPGTRVIIKIPLEDDEH